LTDPVRPPPGDVSRQLPFSDVGSPADVLREMEGGEMKTTLFRVTLVVAGLAAFWMLIGAPVGST
jgi:hypothetical protein